MKKVEEWRSSTTTREIASQMVSFIEARLELMKLYEQIANEGLRGCSLLKKCF